MPTFTHEVEIAAASCFWLALKDAPVLLPKIAPQFISSIEVEGGDGVVGSVRTTKFGTAAPEGAFVKEKLTAMDHENLTATSEEIAGGHITQGFTKWASTLKLVPIDDTKATAVCTVEYEGSGPEDAVEQAKGGITKLFTGISAYIVSSGAYA